MFINYDHVSSLIPKKFLKKKKKKKEKKNRFVLLLNVNSYILLPISISGFLQ